MVSTDTFCLKTYFFKFIEMKMMQQASNLDLLLFKMVHSDAKKQRYTYNQSVGWTVNPSILLTVNSKSNLLQKCKHTHTSNKQLFSILIFIFSLSPTSHFHINVRVCVHMCVCACRWLQSEGSPTYLGLNNREL